jgi:hypothetical protein
MSEESGGFDLMLKIKRSLDPNKVMNPDKYLLDRAFEGQHPVSEHPQSEEGFAPLPLPFRPHDELKPPPVRRVTDVAIMRFDHIYEGDPKLMQDQLHQQSFPNWDTPRIAHGRENHLEWMRRHWSSTVVSGQQILGSLEGEKQHGETRGGGSVHVLQGGIE